MKKYLTALMLSLIVFTGCEEILVELGVLEEDDNGTSTYAGIDYSTYDMGELSHSDSTLTYDGSKNVFKLDWEGQSSMNVTVQGTFSGQDMILVKSNANSTLKSGGTQGVVTTSSFRRTGSSVQTVDIVDSTSSDYRVDYAPVREFQKLNLPAPENTSTRSVSRAVSNSYSEGDSELFWVEDVNGDWTQIDTTLRYNGENCYIWVADDNWDSSASDSNTTDNLLSQTDIDAFGDQFDGANKIYEWVTNLYGFEYGGGASGNGGIDGDYEVHILLYDISYDHSVDQTGGTLGYFWEKDEYSDAQLQPTYRSNEKEMFYMDAHFLDYKPGWMYSTLAHELQHMIHFNVKKVEHGLGSDTWFNEMLSMLAEDLLQDKMGVSDDDSPKSRASQFVGTYYGTGVTDWDDNSPLPYYASSYIFGAFLTRGFGGAKLVEAIMQSPYVDINAVTDALSSVGYSLTFDDVFEYYQMALVYEAGDAEDGMRVFDTNISINVGDYNYTQSGFNLYDYINAGDDNTLNTSDDVDWMSLYYSTADISLRPYGSLLTIENDWFSLSGYDSHSFSVTAPDEGVEYYLMFK